jgi:four helix bundle protein
MHRFVSLDYFWGLYNGFVFQEPNSVFSIIMRTDKGPNLIIEITFQFSLKVIDYTETLVVDRKYRMADQLFRSATSIGANVREAQNSESRMDFIHKMKIAAKEADETQYWLELCMASPHYPCCLGLMADVASISRILSKIIGTSKRFISQK